MPKNPDEIGALWMKSSAKGDYMTGTINNEPIVCFQNKSENPKAPQWRVLKSKPKGEPASDLHDANAKPQPTDDEIPF